MARRVLGRLAVHLAAGADAARKGAGALAGDVDEVVVGGELVEGGQELLGLGKQLLVVVFLDLGEDVVDAETIVAHGALEIGEVGLLAREALEDAKELRSGLIEGVVERDGVTFGAALIAEGLLPEVRD